MNGTRHESVREVWEGEPGGYHLNDKRDVLWVNTPTGTAIRLPVQGGTRGTEVPPVWGFEEHEDGTITVTPSIWLHPGPGVEEYHGFLQRGVWT